MESREANGFYSRDQTAPNLSPNVTDKQPAAGRCFAKVTCSTGAAWGQPFRTSAGCCTSTVQPRWGEPLPAAHTPDAHTWDLSHLEADQPQTAPSAQVTGSCTSRPRKATIWGRRGGLDGSLQKPTRAHFRGSWHICSLGKCSS